MAGNLVLCVALLGAALASPVSAKKPAAADEAAVRAIIERVYAHYSRPISASPEDENCTSANDSCPGRFELDYSRSLDALHVRWAVLMGATGELYNLNGFDWYCQCQDYDNATSKLVRQSYKQAGKDRMNASILFSPGQYDGKTTGQPLIFQFRREDGAWKLDDLKFSDKSTLRKGLAADIKDATKDLKIAK